MQGMETGPRPDGGQGADVLVDDDNTVPPSRLRRLGLVLFLAFLFVGLASLFAGLLKPLVHPARHDAPARPASTAQDAFVRLDQRQTGDDIVAPPLDTDDAPPTASAATMPPAAPASAAATAPAPAPSPAPVPLPEGPVVAIMLTELGPNTPAAETAIARLPAAISLAFSPYADSSRTLSVKARRDGHDVWVSVPMQPKSYPRLSPGAHTLLAGNSAANNLRHLDWALGRVEGEIGITNMMGSALTESQSAMAPVIGALKTRGLAYVDARSSGRSIATRLARQQGVASAMNDRFLDEDTAPAAIDANLKALEIMAKRQGRAIGYARALPVTIDRLSAWQETLAARGITLVPVRSVAVTQ